MATLYAQNQFNTDGTQRAGARWVQGETITVTGQFNLSAALALNDVIQMVPIPQGAFIQGITLSSTDTDTNGSPAIIYDVGDGSDTDRFIDGSTIGQAGGVVTNNGTVVPTASSGVIATGLGYKYTVDDTIDVLVQVAPGTGATSGSILLTVTYYCGERPVA